MALARNAHPKTAMTTAACAASRAAFVIAFPSSSRQEVENAGQDQKGAKGPTRLPVHYARLFRSAMKSSMSAVLISAKE